MSQIEQTIAEIRRNVEKLVRVEARLVYVRGGLEPARLPGAAALDVAIGSIGAARQAADQAEHELELEAGLYLDEADR